jgi:hypothetical protein
MGSVASALLFGVTLLWLAARLPTWVPFDPSLQETAAQGSPSHEREEAVATYEALVYKFDLTAFRDDEGSIPAIRYRMPTNLREARVLL